MARHAGEAFSFRIYETEAGESLSEVIYRLAWSIYQAPGQPGLYNKTLYQKK